MSTQIEIGSRVRYIGLVDSHRGVTGIVIAIAPHYRAGLERWDGTIVGPEADRVSVRWDVTGIRDCFGRDVTHECIGDRRQFEVVT